VALAGTAGSDLRAPRPRSTSSVASLLSVSDIAKSFPGVRALDGVSFELRAGEVTALLGENGAGKSTLVRILTGIHPPDRGEVRIDGRAVSLRSPRDAWAAGIAAIHQETAMFDELSVAENIFMGRMPRGRLGLVDTARMRDETQALLARLDARFDARVQIKRLGVAEKHLVGIARALSHDSRIVIMDEPTASLSAHEIDELHAVVERLRGEGRAILYISHKFEEIFRIADRFVCLRDGRQVGQGPIEGTTQAELVRLMVGRPIEQVFPKRAVTPGPVVLEVEDLSNATEFDGISFRLQAGRILGFYGLIGAGRSESMQALFGLSRPSRGSVQIDGRAVSIRSPAEAIKAGIAMVPEDRQAQGAVLPLGVRANTTLASLGSHARGGFLSAASERGVTRRLGERLAVKAAHWDQRLLELSGGNQQKVVLARWLATAPRILILDEPTKGIDIGSKAAVHEFMSELAAEGLAILLVSSELPEVMGMADEILVMHEGRVVQRFERGAWSAEAIVMAATGAGKAP